MWDATTLWVLTMHVRSQWKKALLNPDNCPSCYACPVRTGSPQGRGTTIYVREMISVIQFKKYRAVKKRYYDDRGWWNNSTTNNERRYCWESRKRSSSFWSKKVNSMTKVVDSWTLNPQRYHWKSHQAWESAYLHHSQKVAIGCERGPHSLASSTRRHLAGTSMRATFFSLGNKSGSTSIKLVWIREQKGEDRSERQAQCQREKRPS